MGQRIPVTLGNIAPLTLKPFRAGQLALVCEGGGQRGIFTAGVLDEFMRAQFNPFDLYFGTSAGAQNLSAYVCNQPGYARKVIMRYTTAKEFFNPVRFVRGGNLIDLDWLLESTSSQMPLAMDTAARLFDSGKEFWMCASRGDDYSPGYFSPQKENWLDIIRASSAIPGFYRTGALLDGISYLDGGISDAVPVQEAARRGAKTIVVIRTVPSQMSYTPQWFKRMERWLGDSSLQPLALGSRVPALRMDYKTGRLCGRYFLATVGKMLAEQPPLHRHKRIILPPAIVANDALTMPLVDIPQANDALLDNEDLA